MNILIVTAMFPPIRTGTSYYSSNLAAALHARGHSVTVVTLRNDDARGDGLAFEVIRLSALHMPVRNYFKHFRVSACFPGNYSAMNRIAREKKADAILLVNHYLDIAFPAIYAARRNRIPLICSVGTQLQSPNPARHRTLNFLDRLICGAMIFPFCARIVSWDNEILRYLRDVHGEGVTKKSVTINYGVNGSPEVFLRYQHDYALHQQILGVGAVIEQRDFLGLVKAFHKLAPEFPKLRLKIIGHVYHDASPGYVTENGLGDRVTFMGEQPHAVVLDALKESDLFFASLTGRYIGLGTATIESMLMGVPTVVNAYAGLLGTAQLRSGEDVMLIDGLSTERIAGSIRTLLTDDALRKRVGHGGRAFVTEHLNWEKVAADYEHLLHSLATANPA
jgi:glycosyltransferase involved in cell wall biosynthesis